MEKGNVRALCFKTPEEIKPEEIKPEEIKPEEITDVDGILFKFLSFYI